MAGSRKTIVRNSALIAGGAILGNICSLLFRLIIARVYGPDGFGVFSIGFMLVSVITTIALFGLPAGVTKFVSEYRSQEEERQILTLIVICFIISIPVGLILTILLIIFSQSIAGDILNSPNSAEFLRWFALQIPANMIILLAASFVLGYERGGLNVAIREMFPKLFILLFTLALVAIGASVYEVGVGYVIARWIAALIGVAAIFYFARQPDTYMMTSHNTLIETKTVLFYSLPLLLTTSTQFLLNWIDTFFVAFYLGDSEVGIYQTAFILGSSLSLFFTAIAKSLFPNFSALLAEGDLSEISRRYTEAVRWGLLITVAPFFYLIVFPTTSLTMIFGTEYSPASLPLIIIITGQLATVIFGPGTELVKSNSNTMIIFYIYLIAAVINAVGNIILIPPLGISGAAVSTSAAASTQAFVLFIKSRSLVDLSLPIKEIIRIISAGAITGTLFYFIPYPINSILYFILSIAMFSSAYIIISTIIGAIKRQDVSHIL